MSGPWMSYKGVSVFRTADKSAYVYSTSHVEIDADGSPNAYSAKLPALDYAMNAGWPTGGWQNCLVPDPSDHSKPFVQTSGKYAGYFVSKTSLQDTTKPETDVSRYVDASHVPYIVFPGSFYRMAGTGALGDFVIAKNLRSGEIVAGVVADIGPSFAPLGEISVAMAAGLGGHNPSPKDGSGAPTGTFRYVVFPGSRHVPPWPLSNDDITRIATDLLNKAGGWPAIDSLADG